MFDFNLIPTEQKIALLLAVIAIFLYYYVFTKKPVFPRSKK